MSDQYVGEIRIFGFNFAPTGWALCNGQLLSIQQNTALFSLLGTFYGGNGTSTFGLPNLQGMVPVHQGQGPGLSPYDVGETGGSSSVTLQAQQLAGHVHGPMQAFVSRGPAAHATPAAGDALTVSQGGQMYAASSTNIVTSPAVTTPVGSNLPHNNLMPGLVMNFCIALVGIYPPRS